MSDCPQCCGECDYQNLKECPDCGQNHCPNCDEDED
jgi:hypothetical protein